MQSALDLIHCQSRNQLETNPDYFWHTMTQVVAFHPAIPARKNSIAILSPRLDCCKGPSQGMAMGFVLSLS